MFLQFCANVLEWRNKTISLPVLESNLAALTFPKFHLSALSPTPRQPRRLSFLRKPPQRFEMFSTTRPCDTLQTHSAWHIKTQTGERGRQHVCFNHLNVSLKVKKVNSLPVAAVQRQNIPGLKVGRDNHTFRIQTELGHAHSKSTASTHRLTHTHTNAQVVNADSPVRPGHSDRESPHPERRRFWKTDRNDLEPLTSAARSFLLALQPVQRSALRLLALTAQAGSANVVFEWQRQQRCVCTVCTGQTYLNKVTPWKENIRLQLVERYQGSNNWMRLPWLPAPQIRLRSLAKQQRQQAQNRQAGWLARPRLELWPSNSVFSWALEGFFPLIEMIYESKIIPESNHLKGFWASLTVAAAPWVASY